MEYSRQCYYSRLPFPSAGDLPDPGIESVSPASAGTTDATSPQKANDVIGDVSLKVADSKLKEQG